MLVYVTRLWFEPSVGLDEPLRVVARWLSRKIGKQIAAGPFRDGMDRAFDGGHELRSVAAIEEFPQVVSVFYGHPDREVAGRRWITEIGL